MADATANGSNQVMDTAVQAMKDAVQALDAEETRLAGELAAVRTKRKDMAKAVASVTSTAPRRGRGRPRKAATPAA